VSNVSVVIVVGKLILIQYSNKICTCAIASCKFITGAGLKIDCDCIAKID
jgi:hypothetical protein